jgi:Flp pilus assembly pilin Flp
MLSYLHKNIERGQGLIEYALIVLFIAITVIAILGAVGVEIFNVFNTIEDFMSSVTPSA